MSILSTVYKFAKKERIIRSLLNKRHVAIFYKRRNGLINVLCTDDVKVYLDEHCVKIYDKTECIFQSSIEGIDVKESCDAVTIDSYEGLHVEILKNTQDGLL